MSRYIHPRKKRGPSKLAQQLAALQEAKKRTTRELAEEREAVRNGTLDKLEARRAAIEARKNIDLAFAEANSRDPSTDVPAIAQTSACTNVAATAATPGPRFFWMEKD